MKQTENHSGKILEFENNSENFFKNSETTKKRQKNLKKIKKPKKNLVTSRKKNFLEKYDRTQKKILKTFELEKNYKKLFKSKGSEHVSLVCR